jgi:hypothetical protein
LFNQTVMGRFTTGGVGIIWVACQFKGLAMATAEILLALVTGFTGFAHPIFATKTIKRG